MIARRPTDDEMRRAIRASGAPIKIDVGAWAQIMVIVIKAFLVAFMMGLSVAAVIHFTPTSTCSVFDTSTEARYCKR